jgi:hypothetical protein
MFSWSSDHRPFSHDDIASRFGFKKTCQKDRHDVQKDPSHILWGTSQKLRVFIRNVRIVDQSHAKAAEKVLLDVSRVLIN